MTKAPSHVHARRTYFGEFTAAVVIDWLNDKRRPAGDPVEKLIRLNAELGRPFSSAARRIDKYVADIVYKTKLAVAPVTKSGFPRWKNKWNIVGLMDASQGLALFKLLDLAEQGVLSRVRKCGKKECGKWFYARFKHQRFHAQKCQLEAFRSDADWRKQRAEYMKQLRQEKKLRESSWLRVSRRKESKK